jgi:hypothetical protein
MLKAKVQDDSTSQQSQVVSSFNALHTYVTFIMVKLREHAMCNSLTAAVTGEIAIHLLCTITIHVRYISNSCLKTNTSADAPSWDRRRTCWHPLGYALYNRPIMTTYTNKRKRQRRLAAYPVCMAFDEGLAHFTYAIYLATMQYHLFANGGSVKRLQASEHVHKQAANQPYIMRLEVNASSIHTCYQQLW